MLRDTLELREKICAIISNSFRAWLGPTVCSSGAVASTEAICELIFARLNAEPKPLDIPDFLQDGAEMRRAFQADWDAAIKGNRDPRYYGNAGDVYRMCADGVARFGPLDTKPKPICFEVGDETDGNDCWPHTGIEKPESDESFRGRIYNAHYVAWSWNRPFVEFDAATSKELDEIGAWYGLKRYGIKPAISDKLTMELDLDTKAATAKVEALAADLKVVDDGVAELENRILMHAEHIKDYDLRTRF